MTIRLQDWQVDPALNQLRRGDEIAHLEPLAMNVLTCLLEHGGDVVATDALLDRFWSGRHADPGMVARCVRQIRLALGDDARAPRYLETIRKRGYRIIPAASTANGSEARQRPAPHRSPTTTGIAVMPFDDLSPQGGQDWLAQGLTEELIEFLSRLPGVRVPARSSTLVLKRQQADPDTIARRLDVTTVVDASVRRIGKRITVVVRWTRIADQARLWSARYERHLEDVFAVQKELAAGIAEAIRLELGIRDAAPFLAEHRYQTSNLRAWELFHQGFDQVFTFLPRRIAEGRVLLQQALAHDPDYLAAKVLLAWSDFEHPEQRVQVARQALERDPGNVRAYLILINDCIARWDFASAVALWDRAAAGKPQDNSLALIGYHVFSSTGDLQKTLAITERGVRLDPLWNTHHYFLGLARLNLGRPAAAIAPLETGIALFPETGLRGIPLQNFHSALALARHLSGDGDAARRALAAAYPRHEVALSKGFDTAGWAGMNGALASALAAEPMPAWSRNVIEFFIAQAHARAGAREPMYAYLERLMETTGRRTTRDRVAYRDSCFLTQAINADVDFAPYRREARFHRLKRTLDVRLAERAGTCCYLT